MPAAEAAKPAAADEVKEESTRKSIGEQRLTGLIKEWKGHMGWISPLSKVAHPLANRHWGLIYISNEDYEKAGGEEAGLKEGKIVDFMVYEDSDGLGAEDIKARSVIRLTLGHAQARATLKDSPQWSEYLSDSEYYPTFEREHGVLLRKYAWPLPFVLVELWGRAEALPEAALALAGKDDEKKTNALRMVLAEDDMGKIDGIPKSIRDDLKVSESNTMTRPCPCRTVTLEASREKCIEAVKAFIEVTTVVAKKA